MKHPFHLSIIATALLAFNVAAQTNASAPVQPGKETRDITTPENKEGFVEIATFSSDGHKPLAGVRFIVAGQKQHTGTTDANGLALVRADAGKYTVFGIKDGVRASGKSVQIEDGKTNRVELEFATPWQISGTVRDTNGTPAVGIQVTAFGGTLQSATTDSKGQYRVFITTPDRPEMSSYVMVRDVARNLAASAIIEEGTQVYDLQLAPGVILSGQVQDEQGKPVPNPSVTVVAWGGNTGWGLESVNSKTDAQGHFETGAWPVGRRYGLNISAKGYGTASARAQQVDTDRFEFETFILPLADKKIAGIVVDSDNKPLPGARIYILNDRQPRSSSKTDQQGRFEINELCDGLVVIGANTQEPFLSGNTQAQAGDTNIVITLREQSESIPVRSRPPRASLVGKPLPDLTFAGFSADLLQTNKPLLVCIFDPEQRPSRRAVRLLGDQYDSLKQKNVTVLGLFATPTTADALKEWKQSNPVPFPVSGTTEAGDKAKWILSLEKSPWLILTDAQGRVKAEGFDLDDLEAKLK